MAAKKVAVVGDINGQIESFFAKLRVLQSKQNFAFIVVAGSLFASDDSGLALISDEAERLINGKIEIPVPVYITLGHQTFPSRVTDKLDRDAGELCPNLFALGRRGQTKTTDGVRLVSISGVHSGNADEQPASIYAGGYNDKEATSCISYNKADILITSDWPELIRTGSNVTSAGPATQESAAIAQVCTGLKPRYHFSTSSTFWEREPFFHDMETKQITRFIALAPLGNASNSKWIYAFSIDPSAEPPAQLPLGVKASPFAPRKRKLDSQKQAFNSFRFSDGDTAPANGADRGKRRKHAPPQPDQCYFCLANPACETHMIGSIGDESYITVAKGPLPTRNTYPDLGIPGHMLIIPLVHAPTLSAIPDVDAAEKTKTEMLKYQDSIREMLISTSKDDHGNSKLGTVTWEISRAGGIHNHWQILPVPLEPLQDGSVEAAFKADAEALHYPAFESATEKLPDVEAGNCFRVEIWSQALTKRLALPLDESFSFDLQFGRRVMGKLLGLSNRTNWKDCGQSKLDEEADTAVFKKLFKEHDFTLKEE